MDCRHAGRGNSALEYLSRYLYRGVIRESNILFDRNGRVTFQYIDGETGEILTESLRGADFLWRVIQHVLPRGFHRVRDYGFLHHNARKTLRLIQLILQVVLKPEESRQRPVFSCSACGGKMNVIGIHPAVRIEQQIKPTHGPPIAMLT